MFSLRLIVVFRSFDLKASRVPRYFPDIAPVLARTDSVCRADLGKLRWPDLTPTHFEFRRKNQLCHRPHISSPTLRLPRPSKTTASSY